MFSLGFLQTILAPVQCGDLNRRCILCFMTSLLIMALTTYARKYHYSCILATPISKQCYSKQRFKIYKIGLGSENAQRHSLVRTFTARTRHGSQTASDSGLTEHAQLSAQN